MTTQTKPGVRPADARFSSGPTKKRPGWSLQNLEGAALGRSHRSKLGKGKLKEAIDRTRALLGVPADFKIAIVPASDTGAMEMAMWTMLGYRPVDIFAWESFGEEWVTDAKEQLKLPDMQLYVARPYGALPDFAKARKNADIIFTQNGTTSGAKIPNFDWIPADREGITLNDATSAAFAQPIDWAKCDVTTYSWQKVMGGEAAHGMIILSPRAVARLESYVPDRPLPKIFRMTKKGKLDAELFEGATINTPSMLATEDYLDTLKWGESIGGLAALHARANANSKALYDWAAKTPWIAPLRSRSAFRALPRLRRCRRRISFARSATPSARRRTAICSAGASSGRCSCCGPRTAASPICASMSVSAASAPSVARFTASSANLPPASGRRDTCRQCRRAS